MLKNQKEIYFNTSLSMQRSPEEVFKAINEVKGWWQGEIDGRTDAKGAEFNYQMGDVHYSKQQVVEFIPHSKIVWLVTDSKLSFTKKKDEWTNTKIIFELEIKNGQTKLTFTHEGLAPSLECYEGCSTAWKALIEKSLWSYITTGKGVKVF